MKQLTNLEWVSLAKSSDESRYNLQCVYREKNNIVATDGHRLHWSNGLPDSTPHYIGGESVGGIEADYPYVNYETALPTTPETVRLKIVTNGQDARYLDELSALIKFEQAIRKGNKQIKDRLIAVDVRIRSVSKKQVTLSLSGTNSRKLAMLTWDLDHDHDRDLDLRVRVNPVYLLDALKLPALAVDFVVRDDRSPILIETSGEYEHRQYAIIMPIRIEK